MHCNFNLVLCVLAIIYLSTRASINLKSISTMIVLQGAAHPDLSLIQWASGIYFLSLQYAESY